MHTQTDNKPSMACSLRNMIDEADHLLKSSATAGDEKLEALHAKFAAQVKDLRGELDAMERNALATAKRAARQADEALHAHPYRALAAAGAAGLLIGFLAARR